MVIKQYQLRALVAIADCGSIRSAAESLHLTQPAITKAIRDLEAELGLMLLVRGARGVTLTAEGRVLLARARMIGRELERAEEELRALKGQRDGHLRIGVRPLAGLSVVPRAYQAFRAAWPDINLSIVEYGAEQMYEGLQDGSLDMAIGVTMEGRPLQRGSTELARIPTSFAIRRGSPHVAATSLAQLQALEWLHADPSEAFPQLITALFARRGLAPPKRITRCTSPAVFYQLVPQIDAVIVWTRQWLNVPAISDRVQMIDLDEDLPQLVLHLTVREDGLLTNAGEYFIRCINEAIAAER